MNWWEAVIAAGAGFLLIYAASLVLLWRYARAHPETVTVRDALFLLPDVMRLVRRLIADRTVPAGVRVRLALLFVYLVVPIDLIPDIIPVIGWADDVIIVALVLRSTIRRAGIDALARHWPGTPAGLMVIQVLAGTGSPLPVSGTGK
jgi:uncharacterized membrane protein YkvA (DUF1232 family)